MLIGGKLETAKDTASKWVTNFSAGARLYYGKNDIRGYLQGEFDRKDTINTTAINLGCEFNISNGLWLDFAFNIDKDGNTLFKPVLNLKYGTPEKKK